MLELQDSVFLDKAMGVTAKVTQAGGITTALANPVLMNMERMEQ
ncbi:MAG: hypothetical protein BWY56_02500 [Acidobacteria bacterium ADurb.Bin340]|jgi:hypothetical protein|nr:MAG: hypothetical protein BWY56_02500 [Acidobacteria bacterium ADurb.Bin340]